MRTRRLPYSAPSDGITFCIRPRLRKRTCSGISTSVGSAGEQTLDGKRHVRSVFDALPDDLLVTICAAVSSSAKSPADLVNTMLTCKRFCAAATKAVVLAKASVSALTVRACNWSEGAQHFLQKCADAGNTEACYTLGMIRFYCLQDRIEGTSLLAKAAMDSHSAALYSVAIIKFNGSGGIRKDKDLKAGVELCSKAANLGHVDAMRELGHCFQDGYGVPRNLAEGRRLLIEANAREASAAVAISTQQFTERGLDVKSASSSREGMRCLQHHLQHHSHINKANYKPIMNLVGLSADSLMRQHHYRVLPLNGFDLLSSFNIPPGTINIANNFLVEWHTIFPHQPGLRLCSHKCCGRIETRRHEFRRCSACGKVNYCSRACQALDWKIRHKDACLPVLHWEDLEGNPVQGAD